MTEPGDRLAWPAVIPALLLLVWLGGLTAAVVHGRGGAGLLSISGDLAQSRHEVARGPTRLDDPRLGSLRAIATHWKAALEPQRVVVDQVCLVPDVPAFLEAIAQWDEQHFFPILIDEPALTLPFLRAFRPARVVRYAGLATRPDELAALAGLPPQASSERRWSQVLISVARAWTGPRVAESAASPRHVASSTCGTDRPGRGRDGTGCSDARRRGGARGGTVPAARSIGKRQRASRRTTGHTRLSAAGRHLDDPGGEAVRPGHRGSCRGRGPSP